MSTNWSDERTSAGHAQSGGDWLDAHFSACEPEYRAMLASVGLQSGWHVLDAGCGSGAFLPVIAEQVGATGQITAIDLAAENVAAVEARLAARPLPESCSVTTAVASITELPFPDATFDAVWCAAVTQYLPDDEFAQALAEFRRVVRPGGLVAVKEFNSLVLHFGPADPGIWWRFAEAAAQVATQARGTIRAAHALPWLRQAGLEQVRQQTVLVERRAPYRPVEQQYIGEFLSYFGSIAAQLPLPEADQAFWRAQRDPAAATHVVQHPESFWCEGHAIAVGQVPPA